MIERPPPPPPRPHYLPPELLLVSYEYLAAHGNRGAVLRLDMLRRQIAATEEANHDPTRPTAR